MISVLFMVMSSILALVTSVLCYQVINKNFSYDENVRAKYVLLILIPTLVIFLVSEYISSNIYGHTITIQADGSLPSISPFPLLFIQILGIASLFCIMFAYKKLVDSFKLSRELSLLELEKHSLNQYVEEAKVRYEKTKAFRHDVKNHISIVKELVQNGDIDTALQYMSDMENLTADMSFPVSTNNPVLDILIGNKLGIAKSNQIEVQCSFISPYPCGIADIDFCIIFSNALDNAISACNRVPHDNQKYIHINTDNVDREIEKLKEEKEQLEQQIKAAAGDKEKVKVLEKKLAQIEGELSQKDNDTYRRKNAVIS